MTKQDLQSAKIGEVVSTTGFQAMMLYLTENIPMPDTRNRDATTVATDEGFTRGYLHLLKMLRSIHLSPKEAPTREHVPNYQPPTPANPEK